jgi:hypothetical protein
MPKRPASFFARPETVQAAAKACTARPERDILFPPGKIGYPAIDHGVPQYMRLPAYGGEVDPVCGLNRTAWDALLRPQASNNYCAPVRSITLKITNPHSRRGLKLIDVWSVLTWLDGLPSDQTKEDEAA